MSPQQQRDRDPVLVVVARLETKLDALTERQHDQEKRLRWIMSVGVLAVGIFGGPDAVAVLAGTA